MKIGFIGVGRMGGGLARNLVRAGYDVTVYDISPQAVQRVLEVGGRSAKSPVELAAASDVVFTSLPMPQDVVDLLLGEGGVLAQLRAGCSVIDVSTIDPATARRVADAAQARGVDFLACPLGKGPAQAEAGTQPIYAGGRREVFDRLSPVLTRISSEVYYVGDVEQAAGFKLVSNLMGMTNALVLCEGLRLGERLGMEPGLLQDLLRTTGADSYQLTLRGPKILRRDYSPGFSVRLTLKDVRLGVQMAAELGQPAPFSELAKEWFQRALDAGFGEDDCAVVYELFRPNDTNTKG
ncbi:MAG: NAD(P)-dependent oxidoreductase [Alicyclobacillus sp.]|nr:NAD(P)-dependent oxidoreductase [Alicyclobacillus sp.]